MHNFTINQKNLIKLLSLDKSSAQTLQIILEQFNGNIEGKLIRKDMNDAEKQLVKRGIATLKEEKIIFAVPKKRSVFVLNPYIFNKQITLMTIEEVNKLLFIPEIITNNHVKSYIQIIKDTKELLTDKQLETVINLEYFISKFLRDLYGNGSNKPSQNDIDYILYLNEKYTIGKNSYANLLNSADLICKYENENISQQYCYIVLEMIYKRLQKHIRMNWKNDDGTIGIDNLVTLKFM